MDEDAAISEELERLAHAHLLAENVGSGEEHGFNSIGVSPEIAETLRLALYTNLSGSAQDMTAIVSVPTSMKLPADWLFRLGALASTPEQLEGVLELTSGALQSVEALRQHSDDRVEERVNFVFVTDSIKSLIEQRVRTGGLKLVPLFVKISTAEVKA